MRTRGQAKVTYKQPKEEEVKKQKQTIKSVSKEMSKDKKNKLKN